MSVQQIGPQFQSKSATRTSQTVVLSKNTTVANRIPIPTHNVTMTNWIVLFAQNTVVANWIAVLAQNVTLTNQIAVLTQNTIVANWIAVPAQNVTLIGIYCCPKYHCDRSDCSSHSICHQSDRMIQKAKMPL